MNIDYFTKEFEPADFKVVFGDKKVKVKIGSEHGDGMKGIILRTEFLRKKG